MAILMPGVLVADRQPAFISQVIEVVNEHPPINRNGLAHACFPGYMIGTPPDMGAWKDRYNQLLDDLDSRMQVLHQANLVWRRTIKQANKSEANKSEAKILYYRHNQRRKVIPISEELLYLPFFEIKPFEDERFAKVE